MSIPSLDHDRKPSIEFIDGVPTIVSDRALLQEHGSIEVLDERTDDFVSLPLRTVHTSGAGISMEIGPFSLTTQEIVTLHNAIADHINSTEGEFRMRAS